MRHREKARFVWLYGGLILGVLLLGGIQVILGWFDVGFYPKIIELGLDPLKFYLSLITALGIQFLIGCCVGLAIWERQEKRYKRLRPEPFKREIPTIFREPPGKEQPTVKRDEKIEIRRQPGWSITKEFPPVVENALPQIDEIQKGSLRYILGRLGVDYVPQLAIDVMADLRQDAVSCLFDFLTRISVDPDRLLADDSPTERENLGDAIGILLEADKIRRDFNVSPLPIYEALKESLADAENLLEKMRDVAKVLKRFDSANVVFYSYQKWFLDVKETLEHWEQYDSREIDEVRKYAERYESLQNHYDQFIDYIQDVVDRLRGSKSWNKYEAEVNQILEDVSDIESRLINEPNPADMRGELDIETALRLLAAIQDEMEKLFKKVTGDSFNFNDVLRQKIEKALKVLGLKLGAKLPEIKKAYRKLAPKYHPDRHPDDEVAEEGMKKLNEAYDFLCKNLKEVVAHG